MSRDWDPPLDLTPEEDAVLKLCKKRKLWPFFRLYRHRILDQDVRVAMREMYTADEKGGRPPAAPERLALAMLLQVAFDVPDHEVPTLTAVDRRWQVVLDCLGSTEPVFSQGTVHVFRERARKHGLMKLLLDKTVALARETKGFSDRRLRAIFDSSPLAGAGRVEDTYNLIGRALKQLFDAAESVCGFDREAVMKWLRLSVVGASSTKAGLDVDWRQPKAREIALNDLLGQCDRFIEWLELNSDPADLASPPLSQHFARLEQLVEQDTEPDPTPTDTRGHRIRDGVAPDRRISLSDPDMRHGRKSKTKAFNGYKRHIAVDADVPGLICGTEVVAANVPEHEVAAPLIRQLEQGQFEISELQIDRGYVCSERVRELRESGVTVISKPPAPPRTGLFSKDDFALDFKRGVAICPAGVEVTIVPGKTAYFPRSACSGCKSRNACTKAASRSLSIHQDELWFRQMGKELSSADGRASRRRRIAVEHGLARIGQIQGARARFKGLQKNQFDLQRAAIVNNFHVLNGILPAAA